MLKPLPFEEAIEHFRDKVILSPEKYKELINEVKAKAFSISGITRMDVLEDLFSEIEKGLSEGITFNDFKKSAKDIMKNSGWEGLAPYRLDTIFRTNIQTAYQAGHYTQQVEFKKERPWWQYVAVMDSRTRPSHASMNGIALPHDDPFWQKNYPPNGFNCRCTVRSLSGREYQRELHSGEINVLPKDQPLKQVADSGFDHNPAEAMAELKKIQNDPKRWKHIPPELREKLHG